ncbi:MAG: DEAD/DEAH box helicase [Clostridium sp.]
MNKEFNEFNLSGDILKAIGNLGFTEPSEVQIETIPSMLNNIDIIVKSQTGSGKTASFGIPLCESVEIENSMIQGLVLVPTRELALQVKEDISNIGRLKRVRVAAVFGKQSFAEQVRELKQRVHIVVGTPGRIMDHISKGNLKLEKLKFAVIDEADKMLNMGFIDQIQEILGELPKDRVTALFSATLPEQIERLCKNYMSDPHILNIQSKIFNRDKIKESCLAVDQRSKLNILCRTIYAENPEGAIIFCNTRGKVKEVFEELNKEGFSVEQLHGDMEQRDRLKTMERFKNKEFKILVATDIASRGIHVDSITHVFNYEVPMERESYVHRIGRTGRAGKEGSAITFMAPYERRYFMQIQEYIGYNIEDGIECTNEEVSMGKKVLKESQRNVVEAIVVRKESIHSDIVKIHISAGKKKKIRNIDVLGSFGNLDDLTGKDVGIIDVQDNCAFVDILNGKGNDVLKNNKEIIIKGKPVRISRAKI